MNFFLKIAKPNRLFIPLYKCKDDTVLERRLLCVAQAQKSIIIYTTSLQKRKNSTHYRPKSPRNCGNASCATPRTKTRKQKRHHAL